MIGRYRLGVDLGTSNTVAVLGWPDGRVAPLLFDGSPALPSAVCADPVMGLLAGRDAAHAGRSSPDRLELNPKRCIDEESVLLGGAPVAVEELLAAVLRRVLDEATRVAGEPITDVTLTCPAAWGSVRRERLTKAAALAGITEPRLIDEPVAAAAAFIVLAGHTLPVGGSVVVYDLGAGTFDASVVRRVGSGSNGSSEFAGFEVLAAEGRDHVGGLDLDAAIVSYLGARYAAKDPTMWRRLSRPDTPADLRARRELWADVQTAKEMLSRAPSTMVHVPLFDEEVPLGREQFEQLAEPILRTTITTTRVALAAARQRGGQPTGIFLVGGGSRIPLVATLLHRAVGIAPTVLEQPELMVGHGSLLADGDHVPHATAPLASAAPPAPPTSRASAPNPAPPVREPAPPPAHDEPTPTATSPSPAMLDGPAPRATPPGSPAMATPEPPADTPEEPPSPPSTTATGRADADEPTAAPPGRRRRRWIAAAALTMVLLVTGGTLVYLNLRARPITDATLAKTLSDAHAGSVNALAFSPDGAVLASGGANNTVALWDVRQLASTTETDQFEPRNSDAPVPGQCVDDDCGVESMAFGKNSGTLVVGSTYDDSSREPTLKVWNVADPREPALTGNGAGSSTYGTPALALCGNDELLATGEYAGTVRLWKVLDGKPTAVTAAPHLSGPGVPDVAFTTDCRTLVAGGSTIVRLWNVSNPAAPVEVGSIDNGGDVHAVAVAPDGKTVAASSNSDVKLWDVSKPGDPTLLATVKAHIGVVEDLAFSPDGTTLATVSDDRSLMLWDVTTATAPRNTVKVTDQQAAVQSVAFRPDGEALATGDRDGNVTLWSLHR